MGALELRRGSTVLLARRRKELALLAWLVRREGAAASRAEAAELFWADRGEERARRSLRQALSELRQAVGPGLETDGPDIRLVPGSVVLDAAVFEREVAEGKHETALARWAGDFLPGLEDIASPAFRQWLEAERERLRRRLETAAEWLIADAAGRGAWPRAATVARRWTACAPLSVRAHERRVEVLLDGGALDEARDALADARAALAPEADDTLPPGLQRLAGRLASGDPRTAANQPTAHSPDFIDPRDMLGSLMRRFAAVRRGGSACVRIEGEEGTGRTRLLREFLDRAQRAEARLCVLQARARPSEHDRDGALLERLLAPLAGAPGLAAAPPEALAAIARVVPTLRERFPGLPADGLALADAVARALGEVAVEQPVVIAIDDVASADALSGRVVAHLLRDPVPGAMLLVTGRPGELAGGEIGPALAEGEAAAVRLQPLDPGGVAQMLRSMLPLAPSDVEPLAVRLHAETGGVPGSVRDVADALVDEGLLRLSTGGTWRLARDLTGLPAGALVDARARAERQLGRLDPEARAVLESAAVLDLPVPPAVLGAMSGAGPALADAIGTLLLRHLLREPTPGTYEIASDLLRRAVGDRLPPVRRRALHRAAAKALAAAGPWAREAAARHRRAGGRPWRAMLDERPGWVIAGLGAVVAVATAAVLLPSRAPAAGPGDGTPIVLADVPAAANDSLTARAVQAAAAIDLQSARGLAVLPRPLVRDVLQRMGRDPLTPVDETVALEIAERAGAAYALALEAMPANGAWMLTARLLEPGTGGVRWSGREVARGEAQVIDALDRLLVKVRRAAAGRDPARRPLPEVTTPSLAALRAYAQGRREFEQRQYPAAEAAWQRAVALDSGFALAWAALADFAYVRRNDPASGEAYLARARRAASRLTEREALVLEVTDARLRGPASRHVELSRRIAEAYPDRSTWHAYGTVLMGADRCAEALPALREALRRDSAFVNAWINVATCQQKLERFDSALAAYETAARLDSLVRRDAGLNQEWGTALVRSGRLADADSLHRLLLGSAEPLAQSRGYRSLGYLALWRQRPADAARAFAEALARVRDRGDVVTLRSHLLLAQALDLEGRPAEARRELEAAARLATGLRTEAIFLFYAVVELRRHGLTGQAGQLERAIAAALQPGRGVDAAVAATLAARRLLDAGDPRQALDSLRGVALAVLAPYRLALERRAYADLGVRDTAALLLDSLVRLPAYGYEAQGFRMLELRAAQRETPAATPR